MIYSDEGLTYNNPIDVEQNKLSFFKYWAIVAFNFFNQVPTIPVSWGSVSASPVGAVNSGGTPAQLQSSLVPPPVSIHTLDELVKQVLYVTLYICNIILS